MKTFHKVFMGSFKRPPIQALDASRIAELSSFQTQESEVYPDSIHLTCQKTSKQRRRKEFENTFIFNIFNYNLNVFSVLQMN